MFTDTHCHIADERFQEDREAALQRAQDAGVTTLVEIAEAPASWDAAIRLAEKYPFIYAALGIHPHHAHEVTSAEWPAMSDRLRALLLHPKVVAVGEFGLDYFRMQNTKDQQDFIFQRQLELAREVNKPVVIHCREAHEDVQKGLTHFFPNATPAMDLERPNGVIHCFSGTWPDAQIYLMHGFLLGFDAPVTYPSSKGLKEIIQRMPMQRAVLETDSPYLPPQSHRGQRNEPSYLPATAEAIALLKFKTQEDVARTTTENARRLFRLN